MESFDSSPNYMRATNSIDAKKEYSPGGSECDEIISVSSSTCGSAINGKFNNGIKYRTNNNNNNKTLKNFGHIRSFRRRAKPRIIQAPVEMSDDSLPSDGSPNYLKATSCSKGKKTRYQGSSRDSESHFDSIGKTSSLKTMSRTSSGIRNVRILIKKTSFRPKRALMSYSRVSEDVSVNRATYSSTIKGSKIPEPLERGNEESVKGSGLKVCRYHHCSLHGGCHGSHDDPVSPLKHFLYKKRRSLKKQRSVIPKTAPWRETKLSSEKKRNLKKREAVSMAEPSIFGVENKNGLDSYEEIYGKEEYEAFGDEYEAVKDSGIFEIAYGETSFPERSYQDNLNILRKYEGMAFGLNGYCLRCSCQNKEQMTSSKLGNEYKNDFPQNGYTDVSETNSSTIFKKPNEYLANEASINESPKTPVVFDEVTEKDSINASSASDIRTLTDSNSQEREFATESTFNKVTHVKDSETNSPTQEGGKLQFSKPRHISMWNLIHQHMSSNVVAESANTTIQGDENGEHTSDGVKFAKESLVSSRDLSDSDTGSVNNDSEIQEIELRKLFAIKLVREAIEKILLPEIQDQTSDDQSITSENSPRPELIEKNQSDACIVENHGEADASDKEEDNVSSKPKAEVCRTDDSSNPETIKETEKMVISKTEKKSAPKHWSNLKKWILLQRFIRELEKVKKFNPKKPQHLPLNPDPEAEKVNLRPQTVDERKRSEEWMLDYALRQAVGQLAPTQKRKVGLLVKAFETVVPTQEDKFIVSRLRGKAMLARDDKVSNLGSENQETGNELTERKESLYDLNDGSGKALEKLRSSTDERIGWLKSTENSSGSMDNMKPEDENEKTGRITRIKMWHMIYQHVVSGIAEKVGSHLLDGSDDDEEENKTSAIKDADHFTKSDALKLVKEAVDEILLPEIQDDSSDSRSVTSESISDQEISDMNISKTSKGKNWSKLKKLILVKRSIRALEKARKDKPQWVPSFPQTSGPGEPEKVDLRRQMMDEKRKAEQWMLDYAVQHIVTKLTPARKRRVSMLVEAFDAVVPLPEM
ncbi:hypothetical protein BUALT_Bualt12G0025800 [Buddleja alternifolia]|uniref:Calmodulin-binding domain-containing protein n=1 Tax=Buddleja alternifolia TaxID=168488 RepID=A0AAV6WYQ6_9LAMI|nr:hypothetical protein BUALT_Bualt12G0025800 [Buddleja alternifolia]